MCQGINLVSDWYQLELPPNWDDSEWESRWADGKRLHRLEYPDHWPATRGNIQYQLQDRVYTKPSSHGTAQCSNLGIHPEVRPSDCINWCTADVSLRALGLLSRQVPWGKPTQARVRDDSSLFGIAERTAARVQGGVRKLRSVQEGYLIAIINEMHRWHWSHSIRTVYRGRSASPSCRVWSATRGMCDWSQQAKRGSLTLRNKGRFPTGWS
jgi:hypothetical protein